MATILELAQLSRAAYGDPGLNPLVWVKLQPSPSNTVNYFGQAYKNAATNEIVIAHRGTEPTKIEDLVTDLRLTLLQETPAQQKAVDYVTTIAANNPGWKIINTGHSLGGNNAQAATAFLVDQLGMSDASAVLFNAPGIGGYTFSQPASTYNVLTISTRGDIVSEAGGVHLGRELTAATGPDPVDLLQTVPIALTGGAGLLVAGLHALWKTLGPSHSINTLISYFSDEGSELGSTVWTSKDALAPGTTPNGAGGVTDSGGFELVTDDATMIFEHVNNKVETTTAFNFGSSGSSPVSFRNDGHGNISLAKHATDGERVFEASAGSEGQLKLLVVQGNKVESVEVLENGTIKMLRDVDNGDKQLFLMTPNMKGSFLETSNESGTYESTQVDMAGAIHVVKRYVDNLGRAVEYENHYTTDGSSSGSERIGNELSVWSYDSKSLGWEKNYVNGTLTYQTNYTLFSGPHIKVEGGHINASGAWIIDTAGGININSKAPNGNFYLDNVLKKVAGFTVGENGLITHNPYGRPWTDDFENYITYHKQTTGEDMVPASIMIGSSYIQTEHAGDGSTSLSIKDANAERDEQFYFKDSILTFIEMLDAIEGRSSVSLVEGLIKKIEVRDSADASKNGTYTYYLGGSVNISKDSGAVGYTGRGIYFESNDAGDQTRFWEDGTSSKHVWLEDGRTEARYYSDAGVLTQKHETSGSDTTITTYNPDGTSVRVKLFANEPVSTTTIAIDGSYTREEGSSSGTLWTFHFDKSDREIWQKQVTDNVTTLTEYFAEGGFRVTTSSPWAWVTVVETYDSTNRKTQYKEFNDDYSSVIGYAEDGSSLETVQYADGAHSTTTVTAQGDSISVDYSSTGTIVGRYEDYTDGHGLSLEWNDDGTLVYEERWSDDESTTRDFWDDGSLWSEELYRADGSYSYVEFNEQGVKLVQEFEGADGSYSWVEFDDQGVTLYEEWTAANGANGWTEFDNGIVVDSGTYGIDGDFRVSFGDAGATAQIVVGTSGNDTLSSTGGATFIAGGVGDDVINLSGSRHVIGFNKGDGQDSVTTSADATDTLSFGDGVAFVDIALQKTGDDLIISVGAGDSVILKSWYGADPLQSVETLQVILQTNPALDPANADVLQSGKVIQFDFAELVASFDSHRAANPGTGSWSSLSSLRDAYVGTSDDHAFGGDTSYHYAAGDGLDWMSFYTIRDTLLDPTFGLVGQMFMPRPDEW